MGYQKILVALDRSSQSEIVFDSALEIAKEFGAALMVFHCLPIETPAMTPYANLYGEELINFAQAIHQRLEEETLEVQQWLRKCSQKAIEREVSTELDYKVGDAGPWICEMASNWGADLIVLGRRGRRGLAEMFLGSVSNYVIHHASCSVLVVQGGSA
ncbi:MAG: universal stress protein [Hydrococcus sp. C42_A2020_068]|nr:universal stress protein [Hydrococcus sp. C42_A2020_068]